MRSHNENEDENEDKRLVLRHRPFVVFIGLFVRPHAIPDIGLMGRGTTHCQVRKKP